MPAKKGFCWCIGGSAPPEISYGLENGGMTLKPIEVDIPMPQDENELNALFAELVDELGLDKTHRDAMFNLPAEKKWQIYCSKKKEQEDPASASWPDYYIERVKTMSSVFFAHDEEEIQNRIKLVDSLKTALRTQPMSFVMRFIDLDGLNCLFNFLSTMDYTTAQSAIHTSIIGCIKALMNNSEGRAHILSHATGINIIAQSLSTNNVKTKIAVLEILGAICLVPGGHRKVLQAMINFQKHAGERTRFQSLMNDLDSSSGEFRDDHSLKTAIMSFINAALQYGPGQTHLEFRLHLRFEFLMLGIQPIIDKLRTHDNATLDRHLDFFEMVRTEDERLLAKKFEVAHVDSKSATSLFELLKKKLNFSMAYSNFVSILFHFLHMPFGNGAANQYWQLIDRVVQQVCLQTKEGDPDVAPLELDVKKIVKQLANENAMKEVQNKIRDIQKENDELASKLAKKERECEVKAEEKEDLMQTLNKIKSKLEKETSAHVETKAQLADLSARLSELGQLVDLERAERVKLENAVKTGSLPDDAKVGLSTSLATALATRGLSSAPPPPPLAFGAPPPPPPPCGVPPPPPFGGAPPPPPALPGMGPTGGYPGQAVQKKNIPKPSQALKSFNWAKLPDNKVNETIWRDIDDTKVYRTLDLGEFEKNFSAYQRPEGSDNDIFGKGAAKPKELSVIDGRRAQNCTILLSKLKMTNAELAKAILSVDTQEEIPKDMCEQLLKYVPTPEEIQLLGEHEHEIEQMARADRFLFEMSKVDHYGSRLKALHYKKKFSERMSDAKPKVEAVLEASKEVYRSRKLKKLLELVLAFGNFMNRGNRGNASGFKMQSLNKIIDTKSSLNRSFTLLHYLVEVVEKQFPELMTLENEFSHVKLSAKTSMSELDAEVNVLRSGLKDIEKEMQYFKNKNSRSSGDKFATVMADFLSVATYNFSELEDLQKEMKERYMKVLKAFGEDPMMVQPDEFFLIFDTFLVSLSEARADNIRFKKQQEEEDRRMKLEQQLKAEKEKQKNRLGVRKGSANGKKASSIEEEKGEFDDLISALRTGDVFGEDMAKLKRTRKKAPITKSIAGDTSRERISSIKARNS